jgi:hypothetical protein
MTTLSKIGIGVVTSSNLKKRYDACKNTWLKDFENTYLFGGNGNDSSLINITEAGEDKKGTYDGIEESGLIIHHNVEIITHQESNGKSEYLIRFI